MVVIVTFTNTFTFKELQLNILGDFMRTIIYKRFWNSVEEFFANAGKRKFYLASTLI